ncbi:MAG: hypothetical protein QOF76_5122, partial [Solirubrobacteraceae bacterium]|nr:hypothetical protein [Solirubrobacteraceae bacterium]
VGEACECFSATHAVLVAQQPGRRLKILAGDAPDHAVGTEVPLDSLPLLAEVLDRRVRLLRADPARARELRPVLLGAEGSGSLLLLLLRATNTLDGVLILQGVPPQAISGVDAEVATAFADAGAAALDRLHAVAEHERAAGQQHALTRAAKSLNESLDLETVLSRICVEAANVMDADNTALYRGNAHEPLILSAGHGLPPEAIGWEMPYGAGLSGKVAVRGQAMFTNDYPRIADLPESNPLTAITSALAAPMIWDGELRGVLSVGYVQSRTITPSDLGLLETVAELAAAACANAAAHAGLAHVARTDGLTGCLNHAAMHEGLRKEIERSLRGEGPPLSLILIDLDDFKQVNEVHGHLVGDEVLRRAGHALRHAMRPYDLAARYGGDEFALVAVDADEETATDMAHRALERMGEAMSELLPAGGTPGTAGVAQWSAGVSAPELIARADRALLYAKQEGYRGGAHTFSSVPDHFRPGRFARGDRGMPEPPPMPAVPTARDWPEANVDERLRKRTRQLSLASALGARVSAMTDPYEILDAAVSELHRTFGFFHASTVQIIEDRVETFTVRGPISERWSQPLGVGLIGRCIRERRPVLANDVTTEPDYVSTSGTEDVRSELIVPLWVGDELWGVFDIEETKLHAFHQDDVTMIETLAAQVGSAVRSANLYQQLERAYLGTAEALAAALEAKDAYTADHAASIVAQAEAVGRAFGLNEEALRDLRFAAVFHDIGKIAVSEAILNKPGPLSDDERVIMEQHTVIGEQILQPVEFLTHARRMVRHEHERFDGKGYPDGLQGEEIPLGARIILVCDALHAMTSDRPYRKAMSFARAVEELRKHAGTQFDPKVVDALLEVLAAEGLDIP